MCASLDMHCSFIFLNFNNVRKYSCNVYEDLNIFVPNTKIKIIIGFKSRENLKKVEGLSIHNKRTEYLSINLGEKFSKLTYLRVKDGKLKKVDKNDLKSMPNLRFIDFDSNELEVIEKNLFEFNPNLECIQLDGNHIKSVGLNVFNNLKKLTLLDMAFSDCVNKKAENFREVYLLISEITEKCTNSTAYYNYLERKNDLLNKGNLDLLEASELQVSGNGATITKLKESLANLQHEFMKNYTKHALYESVIESVETRLRLDILKINKIVAEGMKTHR
ncbi:hypothetical protein ACKWTF_016608 [Chironomus riparius]